MVLKTSLIVLLIVLSQSAVHAGFGRGFLGQSNGGRNIVHHTSSSSSSSSSSSADAPAPSRRDDNKDREQQHKATSASSSFPAGQQQTEDGGGVLAGKDGSEGKEEDGFVPLQVLCEVNGFLVPAIIDTGAQITIMSASCAKRCRISNSINTKFSGRAVGVGSSDIIGRIDGLGMRMGPVSFEGKVSVLREARVDFLIGLDLLKRFKSEVNLKDHVLKLQVRDRQYKVPLLNKNRDLEVPNMGSGEASSSLDDPDYYESDYSETDDSQPLMGAGPIFKSEYRSLDSYRTGGNSSLGLGVGSGSSKRVKEPALSLEGV